MFLDFFLEFLTEFSSLLSREDGFLSDLAIRSWLENLPAYLKSLVKVWFMFLSPFVFFLMRKYFLCVNDFRMSI